MEAKRPRSAPRAAQSPTAVCKEEHEALGMTAAAGLQQWGSGTAASLDERGVNRAGNVPNRGIPLHSGHPLQRRLPQPCSGTEHQD